MKMIVTEHLAKLYDAGCRRFFVSKNDFFRLDKEFELCAPKVEDPNVAILQGLGFFQLPPAKERTFINLSVRGCPVVWNEHLSDLEEPC
jgi:hypothetical protein